MKQKFARIDIIAVLEEMFNRCALCFGGALGKYIKSNVVSGVRGSLSSSVQIVTSTKRVS